MGPKMLSRASFKVLFDFKSCSLLSLKMKVKCSNHRKIRGGGFFFKQKGTKVQGKSPTLPDTGVGGGTGGSGSSQGPFQHWGVRATRLFTVLSKVSEGFYHGDSTEGGVTRAGDCRSLQGC